MSTLLRDPPDVTEVLLQRLLEKIEGIEKTLGSLNPLIEQAPGFIAMTGDTLDATMQKLQASGVDLNQRVNDVLDLSEKLTRAETIKQLSTMLDLAQQAPGFIGMMADTLDAYMQQVKSRGLDVEKGLFQGLEAALRLASTLNPERIRLLERLLGALDEGVLKSLVKALDTSSPVSSVGMMGLMKQMNDPDVQRALGFITRFAKTFGQGLKENL